ncbi:Capsular polysaccharide biosynthesis protein [Gaiella occulta]|uniref:protein-tyrosine-phosphatase n=1 Tax=Gaiella occulta TaxID=1002870 RepID=A0A7M2YZD5_9ACTN|nr:Capsular polysaccharide biosynthesis protein [Gaiella occulta]
MAVIDLHSHILPGLDDGARNLEEAIEIARSMADDGVGVVSATPHVRDDYPTSPDAMEAALGLVRSAVAEAGIALDVRGGGEIALDRLGSLADDSLARFGLGGNPRLLLLEYPYHGRPLGLEHECARLRQRGIVTVIAHPERNLSVQERPGDLEEVVRAGAVVQLTAASVDGRLGRASAGCARRLLELELAHLIASDAHAAGVREAGMSQAAAAVGGGELARWLTSDVPAALLEGDELPARPAGLRRRGGLLGRLRR